MKKLIVRADDLGYSEGISLGILSAHCNGIVTCTSVMVNMPYAAKAVALAKEYPNLSLGLHINVTNGKALTNKEKIPSLVDQDGVFLSSTIRRHQIKNNEPLFSEEDAYIEAVAQLHKFKELVGKLPDYIDVHVLEVEPLIRALERVQKEYNISISPYTNDDFLGTKDQIMEQYNFYQEEKEDFVKLFTNQHFTFNDKVELLVCHPGFIDYYASKNTSMLEERLLDYALVTSDKVKQWLLDQDIQLVNFNTYK